MIEEGMTPQEKLLYVSAQLNRMNMMGEKFDIDCPYCGGISQVDHAMCCHKLYDAVGVLIEASEKFTRAVMRHTVN